MTRFEELAKELGVKITIDHNGLYTGMANGLANIVNGVILSDDDEVFNLNWALQKVLIKDEFYRVYPYMK